MDLLFCFVDFLFLVQNVHDNSGKCSREEIHHQITCRGKRREDSSIIHASYSTNTSLTAGCFAGLRLNKGAHVRAHALTHASKARFTVNTAVKGGRFAIRGESTQTLSNLQSPHQSAYWERKKKQSLQRFWEQRKNTKQANKQTNAQFKILAPFFILTCSHVTLHQFFSFLSKEENKTI